MTLLRAVFATFRWHLMFSGCILIVDSVVHIFQARLVFWIVSRSKSDDLMRRITRCALTRTIHGHKCALGELLEG